MVTSSGWLTSFNWALTSLLFIVLGSVHESTQWPESCLKFNKNAVTYATLTRRKCRPSNPEAESSRKVCNRTPPSSHSVIQHAVQMRLLWWKPQSCANERKLNRLCCCTRPECEELINNWSAEHRLTPHCVFYGQKEFIIIMFFLQIIFLWKLFCGIIGAFLCAKILCHTKRIVDISGNTLRPCLSRVKWKA